MIREVERKVKKHIAISQRLKIIDSDKSSAEKAY